MNLQLKKKQSALTDLYKLYNYCLPAKVLSSRCGPRNSTHGLMLWVREERKGSNYVREAGPDSVVSSDFDYRRHAVLGCEAVSTTPAEYRVECLHGYRRAGKSPV